MKTTNFLAFFSALIATLYLGLLASHSYAENTAMDTQVLREQVKAFLKKKIKQQLPTYPLNNVNIQVRNIDERVRLNQCDKPLTIRLQGSSIQRNTTVKTSCKGSKPWSLYISSTIALNLPIMTLRHELPRNHIIREEDLIAAPLDIYSLRSGYTTSAKPLIGKQLKRSLKTGDVVYNYHLQAPDIVRKGDQVTIITQRGGLSVMSQGIALNDASKGEKVRIENQRSTRIIQAKVVGPGTVEVL